MAYHVAQNDKEAIEAIKDHNYDIVLMDLKIPIMNGYEVSETIPKLDDPAKDQIPIIAVTATVMTEVQQTVSDSGMNSFVTKPFNPD